MNKILHHHKEFDLNHMIPKKIFKFHNIEFLLSSIKIQNLTFYSVIITIDPQMSKWCCIID
jgi:hypothetical protein